MRARICYQITTLVDVETCDMDLLRCEKLVDECDLEPFPGDRRFASVVTSHKSLLTDGTSLICISHLDMQGH